MDTQFAISSDGTRIAWESTGAGPALVLLHGAGQSRHVWADWTRDLTPRFRVIAIDIRGHGESDRFTEPGAFTPERLCDDILAVADGAGVSRFALCGYSYGGNIGRYLAARSKRVERFAMIGVSFGPAVDEKFREEIVQMQRHWKLGRLSDEDRSAWANGQVQVMLAVLGALLEWPPIEPGDMLCPTLWLVGTSNPSAMSGVRRYEEALDQSPVQLMLLSGLTHSDELERVDMMLPPLLRFMDVD